MFDVTHLIQTGGLLLIAAIIFAESGMMVGFLFPGDTLLFSAGVLAAGGKLNILTVIAVISIAAIIGDNTGYEIGKRLGPRLFRKKDSLIFRKEYIEQAQLFFNKHGAKTMLVAHFIPVVRSFVPVVAGAAGMSRKLYVVFDAIGDIVWALAITLIGFYLGKRVPGIEKLIEPLLLGIILLFMIPTLYHVFKDPKMRNALLRKFNRAKK